MRALSINNTARKTRKFLLKGGLFAFLLLNISPAVEAAAPARPGQPYAEATKCAAPGVIMCEDFDYTQNFGCGGSVGGGGNVYTWANPGLKTVHGSAYCHGKQFLPVANVPSMPTGSPTGGYVKRVDPYTGDGADQGCLWGDCDRRTADNPVGATYRNGNPISNDLYLRFQVYLSTDFDFMSKLFFLWPNQYVDKPSANIDAGLGYTALWCQNLSQSFRDGMGFRVGNNSCSYKLYPGDNHAECHPEHQEYCSGQGYGNSSPSVSITNPPSGIPYPGTMFRFGKGRWYTVEFRYKLSSPGVKNGTIEAWVDGVKVYSDSDMETCGDWTGNGSCAAVNEFVQQVWYNRNVFEDHLGKTTGYVLIDNMIISTNYIGPPSGGTVSVPAAPTDTTVK